MFPSAAYINDGKASEPPRKSSGWLQNSSYAITDDLPKEKHHRSSSKHQSKKEKKRKREHSRSPPPVEQTPNFPEADFFEIDRRSNKNIYKFGSTYEGELAKYNIQKRCRILGFERLRVLDLNPEDVKAEVKRNRRLRYFSKRNRKRIATSVVLCFDQDAKGPQINENTPYIPLSPSPVCIPPPDPKVLSSLNLKEVAALNRLVYDSPGNIQAWLKLVELQMVDGGEDEFASAVAKRFALLEKQIVIVERAISANSGNLRLKLLLCGLHDLATQLISAGSASIRTGPDPQVRKNLVAQEFTNLAFTYPQFVAIWRGYIAHLRGRFAMLGSATSIFNRIDAVYRRAITTLSGIVSGRILSHKPQADTADLSIDLFAEYCAWLSQSGFTEQALSMWQTAIEFVCFCPLRLQSIYCTTFEERHQSFQAFWESKPALFGHPEARGWAAWHQENERSAPKKTLIDSKQSLESAVDELEEDWGPASATRTARWYQVSTAWNQTAEAAEDALLQLQTEQEATENPELQQQQTICGFLGSLRTRGLAWIGLERTREALGWLPASTTTDQEMEDTEREVNFDTIQPCLLEMHLQPDVSVECVNKRNQRLILLFLEFLGLWDDEIASSFNLPIDLRLCHELSDVSFLQRQRIAPRQFGFPWFSNSASSANTRTVGATSARMRNALVGSTLEQASRLFTNDLIWTSTIGQLRFRHLTDSISAALESQKITGKMALTIWRRKAKNLLSSHSAQADLHLWSAFARGLVQTGLTQALVKPSQADLFFAEARHIFTSTLRMYPVPKESDPTSLATLLSRLQTAHSFLAFELCVDFPVDFSRPRNDVCVYNALHLIRHVALGGAYISPNSDSQGGFDGIAMTEAATLLTQRLNYFKASATLEQQEPRGNIDVIVKVAVFLASFIFHLHFLLLDENSMEAACRAIFQILREIDIAYSAVKKNDQGIKASRFSSGDGTAVASSSETTVSPGFVTRRFIRLVLPSLTSISLFRQRNRCAVTERFLAYSKDFFSSSSTPFCPQAQLPLIITPMQWTYLLPYRIGATCVGNLGRTCSMDYQKGLQGLLPPLVLSSLQSRFFMTCKEVLESVSGHITRGAHLSTVGRRSAADVKNEVQDRSTPPAILLGYSTTVGSCQVEMLAHCLPSCLDLLSIGLELERWTSLVAGVDVSDSDPTSHCWSLGAIRRLRSAFEAALAPSSMLTRYPQLNPITATLTPSFWADHIRTVLWSAYMAFEFNAAAADTSQKLSEGPSEGKANSGVHRQQRAAVKSIFYRAIEDLPWAKILYMDLVRYCPEDVEEVVDLLANKGLRLRTPLEEVDLLLHSN